MNSFPLNRVWRASALVLNLALLAGCQSKQERALDQAKLEAAKTGQPQTVTSVDKNGTTTTTVVQPPAQGEQTQAMTTTVTPHEPGTPLPPPSAPKVSAIPQPPPRPASVTIPAGTTLAVRVDHRISVKTADRGDPFTGEVVDPIVASDSSVLVPKGSPVDGVVTAAHRRGRFKGRSLLELRLTTLTMNGTKYSLKTSDLERSKKGKGRRSAALIGGGSGVGMLIGGLATGGVGLVVGGLAGAGAGTAGAGLTGNRDIDIPAESVLHFVLARDLVVEPAG